MRFAPITGQATPNGRLHLTEHSCLRVRVPDDAVRLALPLAGKRLAVGGTSVRLGVPSLRTLTAAPSLIARLVTFKNAETPERFLTTARARLAELGIAGEPLLPVHLDSDRAGEPMRRVVRVKGVTIPGYSLIVAELSAADSVTLQEKGLGGRARFGCGFFVPTKDGTVHTKGRK
jgi:CRISPR-associated protein Cas6